MKQFVRNWAPPALLKVISALRPSRTGLKGPYGSWTQASADSSGYDNTVILETVDRVTSSALADGKACQDGVVVDGAPFPFPLAACLLRIAAQKKAPIRVVDFGGGLGSVWHRCQTFLAPAIAHWSVVEQRHFVALGRERYRTDHLDFFGTLEEAAHSGSPDAIVFSSVLQYLENPYGILNRAIRLAPAGIVVDRTPFGDSLGDLLMVQQVPPAIYDASYPLYIFGTGSIESNLAPRYRRVLDFPAADGVWPYRGGAAHFRGEYYERFEG